MDEVAVISSWTSPARCYVQRRPCLVLLGNITIGMGNCSGIVCQGAGCRRRLDNGRLTSCRVPIEHARDAFAASRDRDWSAQNALPLRIGGLRIKL
jgi:hypothetical protein